MGRKRLAAIVLGAVGGMGMSAQASLTPIQTPPSSEPNQAQILSHFYGGTFTASGNDFTNGSLKAVRLDDSGADSFFTGEDWSVKTLGKFAERQEGFGFVDGTSGGTYHKLFDVSGSNYNATGSASVNTGSGDFRWAMNGVSAIYTTHASDNAKQQDAAITYRIDGASDNVSRYALFFENLNADEAPGVKTRNDYNDLVVEVASGAGSASAGGANAAPLPAAVWPGSALLGGLLAWRSRKRLRIV